MIPKECQCGESIDVENPNVTWLGNDMNEIIIYFKCTNINCNFVSYTKENLKQFMRVWYSGELSFKETKDESIQSK